MCTMFDAYFHMETERERDREHKYHTLFNVLQLGMANRTYERMNKTMILVKYGYFTKSSAHADAFLFVDLINKTNLPKQTKAMTENILREDGRTRKQAEKQNSRIRTNWGQNNMNEEEVKKKKNNKESRCIKANVDVDGSTLWKMVVENIREISELWWI